MCQGHCCLFLGKACIETGGKLSFTSSGPLTACKRVYMWHCPWRICWGKAGALWTETLSALWGQVHCWWRCSQTWYISQKLHLLGVNSSNKIQLSQDRECSGQHDQCRLMGWGNQAIIQKLLSGFRSKARGECRTIPGQWQQTTLGWRIYPRTRARPARQ